MEQELTHEEIQLVIKDSLEQVKKALDILNDASTKLHPFGVRVTFDIKEGKMIANVFQEIAQL